MDYKNLLISLEFKPKENTTGVFIKKYPSANNYCIEVDLGKQAINYGDKILSDSKTTQNFSQPENFVVLECVNRLLGKGYQPENIILEKTWNAGHGTSGRLDICVTRDDGSEYLLIECKTYGKELDREFVRMKKDGGQLFTYFKFSNKPDVIMLYASELKGKKIVYRNEIIKIEDDYRTGDVKDFYEKWNKLTKDNGVFDAWVKPYNFQSKAITKEQLKEIRSEDSSFIFNRFLEILRHHVVSDKGNAFNKIFTLFLCKVYDETSTFDGEELQFQWIEGVDNHVDFQLRLTDLYAKGMRKFLERTVSDFNEEDFNNQCKNLQNETKEFLLREVKKLRLEKNNEFAIKEVYDKQSFEENAKVVKEVVELIQGYRIRYNKRQQYLSDFFEQLLTTGLKQEAGQFFTPIPISQFIIKSLPIDTIVFDKLKQKDGEILPYMIDYAAGSGHFITEYMHEVQSLISNQCEAEKYIDSTAKKIKNWQDDHFDWATQYVYGVEKDYRLVKVGKVGCYLHGDGLANVILSDGLANFRKCKDYRDKLKKDAKDTSKDNQQFDILMSNPPYSISAFRQTTRDYYTEKDFDLYDSLTDNSSEIECLFVERTKQLLKDGGVAGIILPSSILSNEGIYTKAREILLKYFEIIAITELGSNTFMATGTNTVVLFLRRRNNYDSINLKESVERFFVNFQDVTLNGIEKPFSKYVEYIWEGLSWEDYLSLLKNNPFDFLEAKSELYREYRKKLKVKNEKEFWQKFIETEKEKLLYFILAYPQEVVLVKTGEKEAEKRFLGYEFSNRRGSEGIHPIQRGKTIDECTCLFDDEKFDNPKKASTYIYKAFSNDYEFPIHESLKNNISRVRLVDMLTFDRAGFAKNISTAVKKKVRYEDIWTASILVPLNDVAAIQKGTSITKEKTIEGNIPVVAGGVEPAYFHNVANRNGHIITVSASGANAGFVNYFMSPIFASDCITIQSKDEKNISTKLIYFFLKSIQEEIYGLQRGQAQPHVYADDLSKIQIPLPPKEIQEKIVSEIEVLEKKEVEAKEKIKNLKTNIVDKANNLYSIYKLQKLGSVCDTPIYGANESAVDGNQEKDYRYIRITDIKDDGTLNNDWKTAEKVEEKYILKEDDFLFARSGATAGKTFLYKNKYGKALYAGYLIKFPVKQDVFKSAFLNFILKSTIYQNWVLSMRTGTAQPNINAQQYSSFEIPVPPLSEQQKIVSEIEKIETQISELGQQLDKIPKEKEKILKKYLSTS